MTVYRKSVVDKTREAIKHIRNGIEAMHDPKACGPLLQKLKEEGKNCSSCSFRRKASLFTFKCSHSGRTVKHYNICQYHNAKVLNNDKP